MIVIVCGTNITQINIVVKQGGELIMYVFEVVTNHIDIPLDNTANSPLIVLGPTFMNVAAVSNEIR